MDELNIALTIDLAGWLLWFLLTRQLARGGDIERWITADYYISTVLLALSTICAILAALLDRPALIGGIALPLLFVGLTILVVRNLRNGARVRRMQFAAAAAQPQPQAQQQAQPQRQPQRQPQPQQWQTMTAPPPANGRARRPAPVQPQQGNIYSDPLIQDIESRRMTA